MIKIKIELHSAITGKVSMIGYGIIANDGTGTKTKGNYTANFAKITDKGEPRDFKLVSLKDFQRQKRNVWELLKDCLNQPNQKGK